MNNLKSGRLPAVSAVAMALALLSGCSGEFGPDDGSPMVPGAGNNSGVPGGGVGSPGAGNGGAPTGSGGTGTGGVAMPGGGAGTGTAGGVTTVQCDSIAPGRAPLRRLTTYEYNNTLGDLLGDTTNPGSELPTEIVGKGFGNDAELQSVSDVLAEKYASVAEGIAARATADGAALGRLHSCASNVTPATEEACARNIVSSLLPRAYRRPATPTEVDELVAHYGAVRGLSPTITFASGVAAVLETVLQAPDFLYRVETGTAVAGNPSVSRLTGPELATRLSYLFWQTMPDTLLMQAAESGALANADGVLMQAQRLLGDPRARRALAFYFDNVLPITDLPGLERSSTLFPSYSAAVGSAMRQEVQRFIEHEVFENTTQAPGSPHAPGSWPALLTAPYTFVNQALFEYYGASTFAPGASVTGTALQKVDFNTTQRLGLLTLGGVMAGTTTTNLTNPVLRGGFIVHKIMCRDIPLPTGEAAMNIVPPESYTGKTARERFGKHSADLMCAGCHQFMDPIGLALENYDAVGKFRTSEITVIDGMTYDTPIDPTGSVPGIEGTANGPVELMQLLASSEETQNCFADHWVEFAFGRMLDSLDACNRQAVQAAFKGAGYNVKQLLLALTQTDGFQYRPAP